MKKQKMLIALGGLVAAVAASATITVSILASDGGGAPRRRVCGNPGAGVRHRRSEHD